MAMRVLSMRKLREVLRLKLESKLSNRQIAKALSISAGTVSHYTQAFRLSGLAWSSASKFDDERLSAELSGFLKQRSKQAAEVYAEINHPELYRAMKRKGVNRQLLYQEYCETPSTKKHYSYGQFCRRHQAFLKTLKPSMRQIHVAGEKSFIDYCGPRIPIYSESDEVDFEAYVFVAVLGASQYSFVTARKTRSLPDWISANVSALEFFGGVPELLIPDNEKSAVKTACRYDPDVNPTYADFARHYGTAIIPTRPGKPKDKALVEKIVQSVETWIMGKLRHHRFTSLAALNQAIEPLLKAFNERPFQKLPGNRASQFELLDKPALTPLPHIPYEFATFKEQQVSLDYHVRVDEDCHHYSVPQALIGKRVSVRLTSSSVEIFHLNQSVARHLRQTKPGKTTNPVHMPKAHYAHENWTPAVFEHWAKGIGENVALVVGQLLNSDLHPERIYRIHNGFRQLLRYHEKEALERACRYALSFGAIRFKQIQSILKKGLADSIDAPETAQSTLPQCHQNIRGSTCYQPNCETNAGDTTC